MIVPDTRISLLQRLHNRGDASAWVEFCEIYERAVYHLAVRYGLQDADAREVSQEVLVAVSRRIHLFDPAGSGQFRGWLATIARNATIDQLRKNRRRQVLGQPLTAPQLDFLEVEAHQSFAIEAQREQFRWAANQVQAVVSAQSWQAFWRTAVDGETCEAVAEQLNLSVGAVYVARCRILAKLKTLVDPFREDVA